VSICEQTGVRSSGNKDAMDTNTLIIIIVIVILLGGGGFFYRGRR
jgi:LPXTG-motif cell wall-anchored protein